MRWIPLRGIALKMTMLVLGATSIIFGLVISYSYYCSRNIILDEAQQHALNLTLSVARKIEQEFRSAAKIPQNLARFLSNAQPDEKTLNAVLKALVAENKEIYGSTVAFEPDAFRKGIHYYAPYFYKTKDGIKYELLGSDSYNYFQKDWYHIPKVLEAPVWSDPYFDEGGGNIAMTTYSFPLFTNGIEVPERTLRAIITADVSLEWLADLVGSIRVGQTGFCYIISDTGTFVTYPDPKLVMRESIFSLAEELNAPKLRETGRAMLREKSAFVDLGSSLTGEEAFLAFARIDSPGWSLAAIFPKSELFEQVSILYQETVLLAVVGASLLLGASLIVAGSIARPLRQMAAATEKVAVGDLNINLSSIKSNDEVGQLAQAFTRMTDGLKERDRIRDTFGRYLTREVVNRLLESKDGLRLGGEEREITMIMSDLRGFTALTSNMSPEQVIAFLNRYLGRMVDILIDHQGIIDEIIGDAILAFFGAPEPLEDHPGMAVACALKMQSAMNEINALNEADGLPHLEMGVAVNTGKVVVGNIGSEKRAKYGAVGSEVNFTGRIESFSVGGQVLVSQSTYDRLSHILDVTNTIRVHMKGIAGEVSLYEVGGIGGGYDVRLTDEDVRPVGLAEYINIQIHRVDQKAVTEKQIKGRISALSLKSATILVHEQVFPWEDLKAKLLNQEWEPTEGEFYGKVVSVERKDAGYEATVRFTSVSMAAYETFREAARVK